MSVESLSVNGTPEAQRMVRLRHGGTEPQMEFWRSDKRFRAFVGGVGSGKTRAGCVELLRQPAGGRITVAAPTYRMLEDATIQTFKEVCGSFFRPDDFKKSENKCLMSNGTEILFRSCDDPDKLRGPNLSAFWLDEAAMMTEMVWDLMIGRLRLEPGLGIVTTTPRGKNWLYKLFCQSGDPNYHLVQCSSRSNIFLPSYFIESLEAKYSGHWLKQELEGAFVEFIEAMAYEDFKSPVHVTPKDVEIEDLYDPRLPLIMSCDFNNHIMAWPIIQLHGDQPTVITEISQQGAASIPGMVRKFRAQFPDHAAGLRIYGDQTGVHGSAGGQTMYEILIRELGGYLSDPEIYLPRKNPNQDVRVHSVNSVLRGANRWKPLMIHWSAEHLIEDMQRVQWDETGKKIQQVRDHKDDRSLLTHASDALGYWVMMEMPSSFDVVTVEEQRVEAKDDRKQQMRRSYNHGQGLAGI